MRTTLGAILHEPLVACAYIEQQEPFRARLSRTKLGVSHEPLLDVEQQEPFAANRLCTKLGAVFGAERELGAEREEPICAESVEQQEPFATNRSCTKLGAKDERCVESM